MRASATKSFQQSYNDQAAYGKCWQTVVPVFGQIKEARGFRRFLLRGDGDGDVNRSQ